ncbi:MAG: acyltransferase [Bacilli bacterium]|nr:acyltransferase [Bacilli bacterium]
MKKRINFIDIARAFAMIFIVLGHTLVHSEHCRLIFKFLYSFHVVLFFILSGYTFKLKNESFLSFIKNKFIRIMIPYFVWAVLFLIPYMILGSKVGDTIGTTSSFDLSKQLLNVLYGNGNMSALKQNSALWFLPALFTMEVVYYLIIRLVNKYKKITFPVLISSISINYIVNAFLPIILPWGINTALTLGTFFYLGYLFKNYKVFENNSKLFNKYYIIIILIIGVLACFFNKSNVSCIEYEYGYFTLALISGLCLSIVFIYIAYLINKNKVLEYIGRNTMGILIFHKLIILIFQTKLGIISKLLKNSNIYLELSLSILVVILSIIFSLLATEIVRRIFPLLIGEIKKRNNINT